MRYVNLIISFMIFISFSFGITDKQLDDLIGKDYKTFRGIDETGKVVNIKSLIKEGKPAVIIFFALGDKPGTFDFLPKMNALYDRYGRNVTFVAVLLSRSSPEEVKQLKKMLPLKIPVLLAYNETIKRYSISKVDVPYIVFIDKNGKIKRIILRPESTMIKERPDVDHSDYENKTQNERIKSSIQIIEKYIKDIGG
ncbi:MAG TPA: TlpA family protein disulfide reductase [Persephonella sp.]|uniref:Redoxin superfamily protein n=1 Tax=Persephonella marina (strain DSM 14350 / EX-H1) TaxID=123214 RepID=C0QSR1_PERMH|nr:MULTISPECIES: TlpA disulfide reductase family protein [Persephonella]ACO04817.1 Redoxin superfamily protein [Persephonella marina EX-H1]HCB70655.1 TlpA family protein disulfide reductase [Persephonella sp.]